MFHSSAITKPTISSCVVNEDHDYVTPSKLVKNVADMPAWEKSEAFFEYLGFILALNDAIKGKPNSLNGLQPSEEVRKIILLLDQLDKMIDETPPIKQPQRFGNQAFKTWYEKLQKNGFNLLRDILPLHLFRAIPEIIVYLTEGFGNSTRIDYGTGHEMSFIMFLCCLFKIGVLGEQDKATVPCKIFTRYLKVVRKLQQTYRMEPAGSHGVWSLDDYQFVPFIWGSSQLIGHPVIEPPSFLKQDIVEAYADEFMFLSCIQYINKVKTGPFAEHSNQLWGISGVASWSKINGGLIKMYKVEVLGKFPVVQHIVFGSLLPLKPADLSATLPKARMSLTSPPAKFIKPSASNSSSENSESKSSQSKSVGESQGSNDLETNACDTAQHGSENRSE